MCSSVSPYFGANHLRFLFEKNPVLSRTVVMSVMVAELVLFAWENNFSSVIIITKPNTGEVRIGSLPSVM